MSKNISVLKTKLDNAVAELNLKIAELKEQGLKSKEVYAQTLELREVMNKANSAYVSAANSSVKKELNKIIAGDLPNRKAAERARSPWKQAKFDAGIK